MKGISLSSTEIEKIARKQREEDDRFMRHCPYAGTKPAITIDRKDFYECNPPEGVDVSGCARRDKDTGYCTNCQGGPMAQDGRPM